MITLVLASASPARFATLRAAGIDPVVEVSGVDEALTTRRAAERWGTPAPADVALLLAQAKAIAVSERRRERDPEADHIVLGCDSVLEFEDEALGKPTNSDDAIGRWRRLRGHHGILHSGHWICDDRDGGSGATFGAVASTTVHFAEVSDNEIRSYVDTGEPFAVAGGFTIDGLGGPFISGIEGDHHNVVGISLPLLREMLAEINLPITALWRVAPSTAGVSAAGPGAGPTA